MPLKIGKIKLPDLSITDRQKALNRIGAVIQSQVQLEFKLSQDPYGQKWKPLAPATVKRRRKQSAVPLVDTGAMRASLSYRVEGKAVAVGFGKHYAKYHQTGTKWIPQRAMLPVPEKGIPDKWQILIKKIIASAAGK